MKLNSQNYRIVTGLLTLTILFIINISWILRDEFTLILYDSNHRRNRVRNENHVKNNTAMQSSSEEIVLLDECGRRHHLIGPTIDAAMMEDNDNSFCSKEHELAVQQCSSPGSNTVLHFRKQIQEPIPFSVQRIPEPIRSSTMVNSSTIPRYRLLAKCQTLSDYLDSIKYGTRVWDINPEDLGNNHNMSESIELEKKPSRFVPSKCFVPVLPPSPEEICNILNRFSHIFIDGDSLSRHLRQTLIMVMRGGEWSRGAVMSNNHETNELCSCDGQYSENHKCRQFDDYFTSPMMSPLDIPQWNRNTDNNNDASYTGLCNNLITPMTGGGGLEETRKSMFQLGYSENLRRKSDIPWDQIQCENNNYRGLFLTVQGGLHFQNNATTTFYTKLYPIMSNPTYFKCLELKKVQLVWIGATAQSRLLDSDYIHQSREYAIEFNREIKSLILNSGLPGSDKIIFMDWWNMTADSQTSDGLHSLMDVNLAKVSQLLYLMDRLVEQDFT
mmetsp:Transcript_13292/g.24947  ORF Transcript_13292/g.24947 Transcript_13292/m.24947 type:complete len:499 (+) Transcript_13292:131-1627(+)